VEGQAEYCEEEEDMKYVVRSVEDRYHELIRIEDDGSESCLGCDHGEPEDNLFLRDWEWVPRELNALADQIRELKAENLVLGFCFRMKA
jgi:hypothetical protein